MEKGHWYTDENGHHYFVKEGQSPKEGWEATKRRKMINGGKYQTSEDGKNWKDSTRDEYEKYEADEMEFDNDNEEELNPMEDENPQSSELHSFLNKVKENKSNSDKVSVNGKMTPSDAQKMSANLEKELKEIFPGKIVTVGYDIKGDNTTFDYKVNDLGGKSQFDEGSNIDTSAGLLNFKDIISNRTDEFLEELKNQPGLKESIIAIIDKMRKKSK